MLSLKVYPCWYVADGTRSSASQTRFRSLTRLSLIVFIAAGRKRRQTAQQLLPFRTPTAIHYRPSGKLLQLIDLPVDACLEDRRIERHARSLRRRWRDVTLASALRTPERTRGKNPNGAPASAQPIASASSRRAWRYRRISPAMACIVASGSPASNSVMTINDGVLHAPAAAHTTLTPTAQFKATARLCRSGGGA